MENNRKYSCSWEVISPILYFKRLFWGLADGIMVTSLDSHVVDYVPVQDPVAKNPVRAHVHICSRSPEENGGEGIMA